MGKNKEFMIDYFYEFKEILEDKYGEENAKNIVKLLEKISVLLSAKFDKEKYNTIIEAKEDTEEKLEKIKDKAVFLEEVTEQKKQITKEIKELDEKINDKKLLQEEYISRNEKLNLENKIFSMRVLAKILAQEKEEKQKKLSELNDIMNPKDFIKYQKKLDDRYEYLSMLNAKNIDEKLDTLKIQFLKEFLECLKINIKKAETKSEIEKIIYDFRYYLLLQYDTNKKVKKVEELIETEDEISKLIIKKAIGLKVFEKITEDEEKIIKY